MPRAGIETLAGAPTRSRDFRHRAHELFVDGYCVIDDVLGQEDLARLRAICGAQTVDAERKFPGDGFLGHVTDVSALPELGWFVGLEQHYALLRALGCPDPKWFMGFVIQKPPHSPGLYWHQDWWGWSDEVSFGDRPPLLVLAFYLRDVGTENGCLRVLRGTHRRRHALHAEMGRTAELLGDDGERRAHPLLASLPDAVDVPVRAGDMVVQDARLLHATHPNASPDWRPMIFLSVIPDMAWLSEAVQATVEIKRPKVERSWPAQHYDLVCARQARYHGTAAPAPINRTALPRGSGAQADGATRVR